MESVGDKINYPWEDITDPLYLPPKNPIKREKKKLVCSSEREDFIKSGEDQFVRILRVLLNGLLIVFLYNYAVNILCIKTGDGYGFYCLLKQVEIDVSYTDIGRHIL